MLRPFGRLCIRYRNTVGTIGVHCEQGMSRKSAVAAAIGKVLAENEKLFFREVYAKPIRL